MLRCSSCFDLWEIHFERCTLSGLAIDPDVAATLLDDSVDGGQSQAGPLSLLLGREEWLEEMRSGLLIHSAARIGYGQHHVRTGGNGRMLFRIFGAQFHIRRFNQ